MRFSKLKTLGEYDAFAKRHDYWSVTDHIPFSVLHFHVDDRLSIVFSSHGARIASVWWACIGMEIFDSEEEANRFSIERCRKCIRTLRSAIRERIKR